MGQATLGGLRFRLDPESIVWGFSVRTAVKNTVGGRVVQVLGTNVSTMQVKGSSGIEGYEGHRKLAHNLLYLAENQVKTKGDPIKFVYPPKNIEVDVFIQSLYSGSGQSLTSISPGAVDFSFTLELFLASNDKTLDKAAFDSFINRFSEGIGWTPNKYNGQIDYAGYVKGLSHADSQFGTSPQNATIERKESTG